MFVLFTVESPVTGIQKIIKDQLTEWQILSTLYMQNNTTKDAKETKVEITDSFGQMVDCVLTNKNR